MSSPLPFTVLDFIFGSSVWLFLSGLRFLSLWISALFVCLSMSVLGTLYITVCFFPHKKAIEDKISTYLHSPSALSPWFTVYFAWCDTLSSDHVLGMGMCIFLNFSLKVLDFPKVQLCYKCVYVSHKSVACFICIALLTFHVDLYSKKKECRQGKGSH